MKSIFINCAILLFFMPTGFGQDQCGNKAPKELIHVTQEMLRNPAMDDPLMVRLFVHIVANSDGTDAVITADSARAALGFIENFYESHGICFILAGINQVNSTDLMSVDDEDEGLLLQFLIPGCIDIFVHDQVFSDGEAFGGRSWDIPNTYLSIRDDHFNQSTDILAAHELGHCLGLYHTHQGGGETVDRTGICANCLSAGDLLCDTPADPYEDGDLSNFMSGCTYTGNLFDDCSEEDYNPDVQNIMSYAPGSCWEYFSSDQGARMRAFLLNDSDLEECVSPSSVIFNPATNTVVFAGWAIYTAHHEIIVTAENYEIVGSAHGFFGAPATTVLQHVHFGPSTGYVHITPRNPLCD